MTVVKSRPAAPRRTLTPAIAAAALALVVAGVVWGAFAFGAVYPWAYWPLAACALAVGVVGVSLPRCAGAASLTGLRLIGGAFVVFLIAAAVQIVPLPLAQLAKLSPEASSALSRLDLGFAGGAPDRHALSIAPARTWTALALFASFAFLVFVAIWRCGRLRLMRNAVRERRRRATSRSDEAVG